MKKIIKLGVLALFPSLGLTLDTGVVELGGSFGYHFNEVAIDNKSLAISNFDLFIKSNFTNYLGVEMYWFAGGRKHLSYDSSLNSYVLNGGLGLAVVGQMPVSNNVNIFASAGVCGKVVTVPFWGAQPSLGPKFAAGIDYRFNKRFGAKLSAGYEAARMFSSNVEPQVWRYIKLKNPLICKLSLYAAFF